MASPFTTEAFSLLAVGIFFIVLRTYARLTSVGIKRFQPDDYIMLFAAVGLHFLDTSLRAVSPQ